MGSSGKGILVAAVVWIVIAVAIGAAYRFFVRPTRQAELVQVTGTATRYAHHVSLALDSFSGYCILRSAAFAEDLAAQGIKLDLVDDAANYGDRIEKLRSGAVQFAAYTVDSFIVSGAPRGGYPATIVMVIDETRGADAVVAKGGAVRSITDLDHPDARFVLTPNSPSEFLARVVLANFSLPNIAADWSVSADGAGKVYERMAADPADARRAYVLWEPFVSRAVADGAKVLLDSSKVRGYIVDVLVVRREFLRDSPDVVTKVVEAYQRAAFAATRAQGGMAALVREDSTRAGGEALDATQAARLVDGIRWKNTLENYAHFGLAPGDGAKDAMYLEDMIGRIVAVLVQTGALAKDPLAGVPSSVFNPSALKALKDAGFHPARRLSIVEGADAGQQLDAVAADAKLGALSAAEWDALVPVGELRVKAISFARGTARINVQSERDLATLAKQLESWPQYYLRVVGHARAEGDPEANRALALERAEAAVKMLVAQGVDAARVSASTAAAAGAGGDAQAVSFVVGQPAF